MGEIETSNVSEIKLKLDTINRDFRNWDSKCSSVKMVDCYKYKFKYCFSRKNKEPDANHTVCPGTKCRDSKKGSTTFRKKLLQSTGRHHCRSCWRVFCGPCAPLAWTTEDGYQRECYICKCLDSAAEKISDY